MFTSIAGIYRNGKIELAEVPEHALDDTQVIVTFLAANTVDLRQHGIDEAQAAELRGRLVAFTNDWDSPEMNIYDNYDDAKANL